MPLSNENIWNRNRNTETLGSHPGIRLGTGIDVQDILDSESDSESKNMEPGTSDSTFILERLFMNSLERSKAAVAYQTNTSLILMPHEICEFQSVKIERH